MRRNKLIKKYKRVLLYYTIGAINTAVDFIVYSAMLFFTKEVVLSQGIGYLSGVICSFCMNRGITFRDRKEGNAGRQLLSFLLINMISFGAGLLGIQYLTKTVQIHPLLAKLPVSFVTSVINYFGYKILVFRTRPPKEERPGEHADHHSGGRNKKNRPHLSAHQPAKRLPQSKAEGQPRLPEQEHKAEMPLSLESERIKRPQEHQKPIKQRNALPFKKEGGMDDDRRSAGSGGL